MSASGEIAVLHDPIQFNIASFFPVIESVEMPVTASPHEEARKHCDFVRANEPPVLVIAAPLRSKHESATESPPAKEIGVPLSLMNEQLTILLPPTVPFGNSMA